MAKRLASEADLDSAFAEFEKDISEEINSTKVPVEDEAQQAPDAKRRGREVIRAAPRINQRALSQVQQQQQQESAQRDGDSLTADPLTVMAYNPEINPDFLLARQQQQVQASRSQTSTEQTYSYVYQGDNTRTLDQKIDKKKRRKSMRTAAGEMWEDPSMQEWPDNDHRLFVGDLGNDVTDEVLAKAFAQYKSFFKAKVIRDKRTSKTKGFGFVSFQEAEDFAHALLNMNGKYVGSRPCKLRKSDWKTRSLDGAKHKKKSIVE